MEELYKRKLWHQLTVLLEEHLGEEAAAAQLGGLYETFVSDFKHKLNKLALARIQCADADEVSAFAEAALADHPNSVPCCNIPSSRKLHTHRHTRTHTGTHGHNGTHRHTLRPGPLAKERKRKKWTTQGVSEYS